MEWKKCFRLKVYIERDDLIGGLAILLFEVAFAAIVGVSTMVLFGSCERRELYVYGDEFHSVELEVDWRNYSSGNPDGMTVWFYALDDPDHAPYRTTSANVRRQNIYLPGGHYQGVVVDYSPEEYSRQEFLDMESVETARVKATPASYQPDSLTVVGEGISRGLNDSVNVELFGEAAWASALQSRWPQNENGTYMVANQPEQMVLDTLDNKLVDLGKYGDYIPWKESSTYQDSIVITKLHAEPTTIIWKMRIRVWIQSGYNYMWQNLASLSGLADGHYLARNENTSTPCLLFMEGWEGQRTGENSGYISITFNTFGLRPESIADDGMRLNLSMVLRDHATLRNYHFDVAEKVVSIDDQLVLRLELGPDFFYPNNPTGPDPIVLPQVDAFNGTGFGADVDPWEDEPPVDVGF